MKRKGSDFQGFFPDVRGTQALARTPGGWLVDWRVAEVAEPVMQQVCGQAVPMLASGVRWLYLVPEDACATLLVCLDHAGRPLWLYSDVCTGSGLGEDGWPWTLDAYLDVVALADADWRVTAAEIIDQDDLAAALHAGRVTPAQAREAEQVAQTTLDGLLNGRFPLLAAVRAYLHT